MFDSRVNFYNGAVIIKADQLMRWWSTLTGLKGRAYAGAFFPFIFITSRIPKDSYEAVVNHELIHFAQQKELLVVGSWVLWIVEWVYWRLLKGKGAKQTYLLRCTEQEAYDNMWELEYLAKRKRFIHLRYYLRNKPVKKNLVETVL